MSETLNISNTPDYKPIFTKNTHSNFNEQITSTTPNTQTFILLKKPSDPKLIGENSKHNPINAIINNNINNSANNAIGSNGNNNISNLIIPQNTDEINRDIEVVENPTTPPPPEGNEIDDLIIKLLHGNDRLTVLKLDTEFEKFMRDPNLTRIEFPAMSSYQRLIVHRVAQYYKLDHPSIDLGGQKRAIIVSKTKDSRTPALRLCDLVEQEEPVPSKSVKILSRRDSSNSSSENPIILQKNPAQSSHHQKIHKNNSLELLQDHPFSNDEQENKNNKSLEEREAEYLKARARIFKDEANSGNTVNNVSSPSSPHVHSVSSPSLSQNSTHTNQSHQSSHSPPPHPINSHPHDEKDNKKEIKVNNVHRQKPNFDAHKPVMNVMDYSPSPDQIPWAPPINNNTWGHPPDYSTWEKYPPKYNSVPIPNESYMVPHLDPQSNLDHIHQYPHYDKRDHIPNTNINNNNIYFHPKNRYENVQPNPNYPHSVSDSYVYYDQANIWPPAYYGYPNQEPIYPPFYRVPSVPPLRRDYERPPPKTRHLFDPNAPQPHYRDNINAPYYNNSGNNSYSNPNVKTNERYSGVKTYYSQPKLKPTPDNLGPSDKSMQHILEVIGIANNVSCEDDIFQDLRAVNGLVSIKILEDNNTCVAIFKNAPCAKLALENVKSAHFTLRFWSK